MSNGTPTFSGCVKTPTTGMNAEQIAAASCKDAANCYQAVSNFNSIVTTYNDNQKAQLAAATAAYNNASAAFTKQHQDWQNRTGAYAQYALQDGKSHDFVASDYGTCWWGENDDAATAWCIQQATKLGYDGANYAYKPGSWGQCSGRNGDFICAKPQNIQLQQQQAYTAAEPVFTLTAPNDNTYPLAQNANVPSSDTAITCCINYIAVTGNATNDAQSCSQTIQQSTNPTPAVTTPTATTSNATVPTTTVTTSNNTALYVGVAVGFIFLMLSILSVLAYFYY